MTKCCQKTALRVADLVVRAGERTILDVPALSLGRGEVLAIIGPNGAGKSTLLQVAALLRRPDRGSVEINGRLATRRNEGELRREIAMVFQSPLLFDVRVLANASSGLRFHGVPKREAEDRARSWLAKYAVKHLEKRGVRGLSAGEAQRVSLARAFATSPSVLLLDEPFAALDAPSRASLLPTVAATLHELGTGAIFVTHHLAEAHVLADRVAVMFDGRIVQIGTADELFANPANEQVHDFLTHGRLGGLRM
jgi:tungstate transport system ATP-binding protein